MQLAPMTLAVSLLLASAHVFAGELSAVQPQYSKRQLSDCMLKRMTADRTLSYNDATKACKDQLRGNRTESALSSSNSPKPVS